jgi:hypothetical protein
MMSSSYPSRWDSVVLILDRRQDLLEVKTLPTYMTSLSAKHTPSLVIGLEEVDLVRRRLITSESTLSPDLRHSSPIVRDAVWGFRVSDGHRGNKNATYLFLLELGTGQHCNDLIDQFRQDFSD